MSRRRRLWSEADLDILRRAYADTPTALLAARFSRSTACVSQKARTLGLRKNADFMASPESGRMAKGTTRGAGSRFVKGHKTWNTGLRYTAGGRSAETRFQPGRRPEEARNYRPIGSVRLSRDGYLERKVSDDPSLVPARRWQFVHRLVWEAAHGPVPAGHVVAFAPGQFTNVLELLMVDRLVCRSRAEHARHNSMWGRNPELMKLYQLKGAITRQVNRIKQEHAHV